MAELNPVAASERVESVDVLRGFSLLGILLLNIASFGLPFAAYINPSVYGGDTGRNLTTWLLAQTLFDGKMRCIFSMLFGTSSLLMLTRAERRGAGIEAADIYYRRVMWMILFGMLHAYLIWAGDILYAYGVCGLLLFPLRKLSAKALIITACVIIAIHSLQNLGGSFAMREISAKAAAADQLEQQGTPLSIKQKKQQVEWQNIREMFSPQATVVEEEIRTHRSGWLKNLAQRAGEAAMFEFTMFFQFMFLDIIGMLVLGMGLWKAGIFDATRTFGFYAAMAAVGFGLGLPLDYWAARSWAQAGFTVPEWFTYIAATADPGRLLVAAGYTGILMILCKAGAPRFALKPLAAVGRTALSNYLLTSLLMTFLFNGYGLGLFAKLERYQLYPIVLGMWTLNLFLSPLWLKYFLYGPAEWLWRSLTYWEKQPMRRSEEIRVDVAGAGAAKA